MNKPELSSHVATETSMPGAAANRVVGAVFAVFAVFAAIAEALARGEQVCIAGFGSFTTRTRAARQGRNPRTGESVAIAASTTPAFKAAKALKEAVNART